MAVTVLVGLLVGEFVGVFVGVLVGVRVWVQGVWVKVEVIEGEGVFVTTMVKVRVGVLVGVLVAVDCAQRKGASAARNPVVIKKRVTIFFKRGSLI